jgi:hypothetical protein
MSRIRARPARPNTPPKISATAPGSGAGVNWSSSVLISEVLRNRMYAVDYRDSALAREDYAKLPRGASACLSCDRSPCAGACPNGINIAARTREAVRSLA